MTTVPSTNKYSTQEPLMDATNLTVLFKSQSGRKVLALNELNMSLRENEFVCVVGPSGCGKTTLLRTLGGLIPASSGSVRLNNRPIDTIPVQERGIAYVFQDPLLLPWRNVERNATLPAEISASSDTKTRALDWLKHLGLHEFQSAFPRELSGGMRSRVALARALSTAPRILMMDEPFASLDETTRFALDLELEQLWVKERMTICFVTHSIREAVLLADRIVVMTPRPGEVKKEFKVNLPRPRREDILTTHEGISLLAEVRRMISDSNDANNRQEELS